MKKLLQSFWPGKKAPQDTAATPKKEASWQDVPRYPPYAEGYPTVSSQEIVESQDELIRKVIREASFSRQVFDDVLMPVIGHYAGYAHLLPASQSNHHSGAGGLFRHGLEVGHIAMRKAQAKRFNTGRTQEDRRNNEPVWHLAAFIAGMLHDIGKPVIDMAVHDKSGNQWSPTFDYIDQWAQEKGVERYYIRWLDKRGKRHELMTSVNLAKLIGDKATRYIRDHDEEIFFALCEAAIGRGLEGALAHIVMEADKASVSHDLKLNRSPAGYGVPVDRFIVDAMRRLVQNQKWTPNAAGSALWVLDAGVFINWKSGIHDVLALIEKDGTPGIPRDPDTLADILVELGIAIGRPLEGASGEGKYYRYWKVSVPVEKENMTGEVSFQGLRIDSPEYLFTEDLPEPGEGQVEGLGQAETAPENSQDSLAENAGESGEAAEPSIAPVELNNPIDISGLQEVPQPMFTGAPESSNAQPVQNIDNPFATDTPVAAQPIEQSVQSTDQPADSGDDHEHESASDGISAIQNLNNGLNDQLNALSPFGGVTSTAPKPAEEPIAPPTETAPSKGKDAESIKKVQEAIKNVQPKAGINPLEHPKASKAVKAPAATEPVGKESDRPVLSVTKEPTPQPTPKPAPKVDPREDVKAACKRYGKAGEILLKEVESVLDGGTLGEALCIANGQVMLIHPQGLSRHGEVKEIMPVLSDSGMFDMGPTGMRAIHEVNGIRGLLVLKAVGQHILQCFKEVEGTIDLDEQTFDIPKPAKQRKVNREARKPKPKKAQKPIEKPKVSAPTPDKPDTPKSPPKKKEASKSGVAILPKRNMAEAPNSQIKTEKKSKKDPKNGKTTPLSRNETSKIKDHSPKAANEVASAKGPAAELIEEFIEQMRRGEGSLLFGQPADKDGLRWIDEQSISLICSKSLDVVPLKVRQQLMKHPQTVLSDRQIGVRFQ